MKVNRAVCSSVSRSSEDTLSTVASGLTCFPGQTSRTDVALVTPQRSNARNVVFIDVGVAGSQFLTAGVQRETKVKLLAPTVDAIAQIAQYLVGQQGITTLHIVSHGKPGCLKFTGSRLDASNLGQYADALRSWSEALVENAEILLYGCNVAEGERGEAFVRQIGHLTGAAVAASTNLTGNAALGGDWNLEFITGKIQAALAFSSSAMTAYPFVLAGQSILTENFAGADVTNFSWKYGNSGGLATDPFLTARSSTSISQPGGLPGGGTDTPGNGALRLTNTNNSQGSFVIYNQPIDAASGLSIAFDLYDYGGTTPGADGTSFFLIDGSQNPTQAGAVGGSLGYSNSSTSPGLVGGYLGIGFDEFGNFSNPAYGSGGPGKTAESVVLRGSDVTGYKYLTGHTVTGGIDNPGASATRSNSKHHVQIDITSDAKVSVQLDNQQLFNNFDTLAAGNTALPSTLKFGFSASTGGSTNFHEINNYTTNTESGAYIPLVNFTTTTATLKENSAPFTLTAQVDVATTNDVTIPLNLSGTAVNGTDYTIPASITIKAGQKTGSVTLAPIDNQLFDPDKTLSISLGTPTNAKLSPQNTTFTTTIQNVDAPTVAPGTIATNYVFKKGAVQISPTLAIGKSVAAAQVTGATVGIAGGLIAAEDRLGIQGQTGTTGTIANTKIAWSYNSTTGIFTFSGTDTVANYQSALDLVTYNDTNPTPATGSRTIAYTLQYGSPTQTVNGSNAVTINLRATSGKCAAKNADDFNGDGTADILWRNQTTEQTGAWLLNGDSVNSLDYTSVQNTDPNWQVVGRGNFTGNGQTDLLWYNTVTGQSGIWLMNGNKVLSYNFTSVQNKDLNWQIAGVGDFDGDGKADILWRNKATGQVGTWEMNGNTVLGTGLLNIQNTDSNWQIASVGDFNGDCKADIVWRNKATGQVGTWEMNGNTVLNYGLTSVQNTDLNWQIVGVGDFNGDGKSDLLWRNNATGQVGTWGMNSNTVANTGLLTTQNTDLNWQIVEVGDFNGDGNSDLLWYNKVTRQSGTWLLDSNSVLSLSLLNVQNTDPNWQIVSG